MHGFIATPLQNPRQLGAPPGKLNVNWIHEVSNVSNSQQQQQRHQQDTSKQFLGSLLPT